MDNNRNSQTKEKNYGLISIVFVYTLWGIQSLYWKTLQEIPLIQLLAHRIIWSVVLLIILIIYTKRLKKLINAFMMKEKIFSIILCAILIGSNWLLNIYAAYSNQVIEASLGHYITPIAVIFLGVFILKENIKSYEIIALITALIGVAIITVNLGKIPLIAVLLVFTFAIYTFFKKSINIDPIIGIAAETIVLLPFAIIYLLYSKFLGKNMFIGSDIQDILLLISTGFFTAVPLMLFSYGVKFVSLSKIGFIQYYAPTLSLFIGIFIFKESFTKIHLISFCFIWIAILIVLFHPILKKMQTILHKKVNKSIVTKSKI
ncbi:EamA family transporter RarD [Maledivibacter halophilus]|uniref:Chloramphenicol-sensitive protein RarD n=1 Tax=Maledivibacter halophilus TaxID=36842 RepID=A0A1T5MDC1_9FIRM|nr:EamA family transporter RarD [Maledivibacter halophilus]SKC86237.1 chloramphenicol-sensitive protein RarD [Maledivibacter halophilus]